MALLRTRISYQLISRFDDGLWPPRLSGLTSAKYHSLCLP